MVVTVDYDIREKTSVYPISCDSTCLDVKPLKKLITAINQYVSVAERANVLINYYDGSNLAQIFYEISEEIAYGLNDFDAIIAVSHKHKLPLNVVFLAYSLHEDYSYTYEYFIYDNVIKILSDMGFKPMQIYRKINALPEAQYSYRDILEVLKAWNDNEYVVMKFHKKFSKVKG